MECNVHSSAPERFIVGRDDLILITGASGFIGLHLVRNLLTRGFRNVRCFTRSARGLAALNDLRDGPHEGRIEVITGNLLSRQDCADATKDAAIIFHLAAGRGEKSFPDAFLNSAVATRNILEAGAPRGCLKRFVNVSSLLVYSNRHTPHWRTLDETCPVEPHPEHFGDAYSFAKSKQDEIVAEYCERLGLPYVIVRPGYVIGPGKYAITGRVGIETFGLFLHLGGANSIPFTYVENCADAIALCGLKEGIDGEVFNVIDDDLPSSRQFLRLYKRHVRRCKSIYVPHALSYIGCCLWEWYSRWSQGQLDPVFNRSLWHRSWKSTRYKNRKAKIRLGWTPSVPMHEGLRRFFESCRPGALV